MSLQRTTCGKTGHPSRGAALAAIASLKRRELDRPEEGTLQTYYCRRCAAWHTGHFKPYRAEEHRA